MPGGRAIGQAVLDHATDGGGDHAVRIMGPGQGQIQHVGVEIVVATAAVMLGVSHVQIARSAIDAVAEIMQCALIGSQTRGAAVTLGTTPPGIVPRTFDDLRCGKVFDAKDAFRGIGKIDSGRHGGSLLALATPSIG
jgi:hypothetical protein